MTLTVNFDGSFYNQDIEKAIFAALESENVEFDCEVEVVIVDAKEIQQINKENRNIDRVTDVLSFPMFSDINEALADADGNVFLGSMVICKDKAAEQAKEYGHSELREVSFLAVHSTLHLLGYDHEVSEQEEKIMFEKQENILNEMGITR